VSEFCFITGCSYKTFFLFPPTCCQLKQDLISDMHKCIYQMTPCSFGVFQ